jgi:two-component system LytT family response regulator
MARFSFRADLHEWGVSVRHKPITVAVSGARGLAEREVISLLSRDPECALVQNKVANNQPEGSQPLADLWVVDVGAAPKTTLEEHLGDLTGDQASVLVIAPDERFALEAHRLRVCGYVTRPIDPERFLQALQWAKIQVRRKSFDEAVSDLPYPGVPSGRRHTAHERLMVKTRDHIHLVKIDEIDWIEANAGYSWIHTQGKKYLLRGKIKCLEESLPDDQFVRIHRSLIVNIDRIHELQHISRGEYHAILDDGTKLSVSRNYRGKLFSAITNAT